VDNFVHDLIETLQDPDTARLDESCSFLKQLPKNRKIVIFQQVKRIDSEFFSNCQGSVDIHKNYRSSRKITTSRMITV
jgi:hypothetical protein|tara:strand:+ start:604 stop:837 length:234 start_codon:yes stop_codon:yes gene_type:complete